MNPTQPHDRADWEDRLVDRALQELHGDRPPDLAAAIEARWQREAGGDASDVASATGPGRRLRLTARHAAAALLLAAAALLVAVLSWPRPDGPARVAAAQVAIEVVQGELVVSAVEAPASRAATQRIGAGQSAGVLLRRGDRMAAVGDAALTMFLGPFGMVRTEPHTLLEVRDMEVSLKNGWVAAGSLTLAVVAGAASWHLLTRSERAEAGQEIRMEAPPASEQHQQVLAAQAEAARLAQENDALKRQLQDLEGKLQRRAVEARAPVPEEPTPDDAPPAAATGPAIDDARWHDVLAKIDWEVMGRVAAEMGIPLVELQKALEAGEEMPMELAIKIGSLNMKLVEQLPALLKAELPGAGPNGVYTHPLVVGNQLVSLLQSSGQPLSQAQRAAVEAIVRRYGAENEGIHALPAELELDQIVTEVLMKDRMYEELARQLGPEQAALVYPEGAGAYDGTSLFRSGLVWQAFAQPVSAAGPAEYVQDVGRRLGERLGLEGAAADHARQILAEVARTAPAELWQASTPLEHTPQARMYRAGRTTRAAQTQQLWMRRILREVPLTAEQRQQLQQFTRVLVPLPPAAGR